MGAAQQLGLVLLQPEDLIQRGVIATGLPVIWWMRWLPKRASIAATCASERSSSHRRVANWPALCPPARTTRADGDADRADG